MLSHTSPGAASGSLTPRGRRVPTAPPRRATSGRGAQAAALRPSDRQRHVMSTKLEAGLRRAREPATSRVQRVLRVTRRSTPPKNNDPGHREAFLSSLLPPKPCGCEGKQKKGSTFIAERDRSAGALRTMGASGAGGDPPAAAAPAPLGPQRPVRPPGLSPMPRYLRGHLPDFRSAGGTLAREATAQRRFRTAPSRARREPDGGQNFLPRNGRASPHLRRARAAAGAERPPPSPATRRSFDGRAARSPTPPRLPPTGVRGPRHAPAPRGRWGRLPSGGAARPYLQPPPAQDARRVHGAAPPAGRAGLPRARAPLRIPAAAERWHHGGAHWRRAVTWPGELCTSATYSGAGGAAPRTAPSSHSREARR